MSTPVSPPASNLPITKMIVSRIAVPLKNSIATAKASDNVEFGFYVNNAWVFAKLGTAAEIKALLAENGYR